MEVNAAHKNYSLEYGPRRLRLAHSMLFEEFELIMENWQNLEEEYLREGKRHYYIYRQADAKVNLPFYYILIIYTYLL